MLEELLSEPKSLFLNTQGLKYYLWIRKFTLHSVVDIKFIGINSWSCFNSLYTLMLYMIHLWQQCIKYFKPLNDSLKVLSRVLYLTFRIFAK